MTYQFERMPLTITVAESLILELYSDVKSYVRREDIVQDVVELHLQRGGLEAIVKDVSTSLIKKALSNLQKRGLALNRDKSVGYWIFCEDFAPDLPYSGMTLIPTLAREMILELFTGKTVQRTKIIETLTRVHSERGGKTTNPNTILNAFKAAVRELKKKRLVDQSAGRGYWTVHLDPVSSQSSASEQPVSDQAPGERDAPEPKLKKAFKEATGNAVIDVGKTIGNGEDYVYVYYYPLCLEYAKLHGKIVFACKIGETTSPPTERVRLQLNESTFQYPVIGLTIRTNNRQTLEVSIHNILKLQGKELKSAHGKEWFITSPSEVERIYKGIMKI